MVRLKVPPYEVNIFLRFRFSSQHRPCCFSRARPANYQLDIELLRPAGNPWDIQNIEDLRYDPVGFVVDGRLYTDDEPYWECLLEEGKTYDVAYLKQPFGLGFLRLYDLVFRVPVFPEAEIPAPNPNNCTSNRKAVLLKLGLIPDGEIRGYRITLSDGADRMYAALKSIPKEYGRYGERLRRVVPDVPEVDYDAIVRSAFGQAGRQ